MADFYQDINLNIYLIFIVLIKHCTFVEWFAPEIPNGIISKHDFARFIAIELDNYLIQSNIVSYVSGSLSN